MIDQEIEDLIANVAESSRENQERIRRLAEHYSVGMAERCRHGARRAKAARTVVTCALLAASVAASDSAIAAPAYDGLSGDIAAEHVIETIDNAMQ